MNQVWLYTIGSVAIVSFISLIGVVFLAVKNNLLERIIFILVAFAAGSLVGDAFIHLIPEAIDQNGISILTSISILLGIITFFVMEKIIHWRHCHSVNCENHPKALGTVNLIGDAFHNIIDGVLIAGSYMVNIPLGVATTIAVIAHEVPQEIGEFGILVHSGYSKRKALFYNFLSALTAVVGAIIILVIGENYVGTITKFIIPFTAGSFIYIALSDLIPELHKELELKKSLLQLIFFVLGILLMIGLLKLA